MTRGVAVWAWRIAIVAGVNLTAAGCGKEADRPPPVEDLPPTSEPAEPVGAPQNSDPAGPQEADHLRDLLATGTARQKVAAAYQAAALEAIPAVDRTALLVTSLRRELEEPTLDGAPSETYLSTTDWIRAQMTRAMGRLAGEGANVAAAAARESGELGHRLVLARGYAGDRRAAVELRKVLLESDHGDVRTQAAYLLGELGDTTAIPELTGALDDPHLVSYEDHGQTVSFYSVRQHAALALGKLGVVVTSQDDGTYEVRSR